MRVRYLFILNFLIILLVFCSWNVCAEDYYIDFENGSNTSGDGSQGNPWKTVSYAIKRTETNETDDAFHVAEGLYSNDPNLAVFDREVFPMKIRPGTSIIGAGAGKTIVDAGFLSETTSRFIEGVPDTDITNILVQGITFQNNNVTNSLDGPAIYLNNASGAIRDCEFINISTNNVRGAVWIVGTVTTNFDCTGNLFKDCKTTDNSGIVGACIISDFTGDFSNNTVENCQSRGVAGVHLTNIKGNINGNTIIGGKSFYNNTGGMYINGLTDGEIAYNVFDGNAGQRVNGGQLYIKNVTTRIHHNSFYNTIQQYGNHSTLGIDNNSTIEIDNNDFAHNFENKESDTSGAIYIYKNSGEVTIHHNNFTSNNGQTAAILYNQSNGSVYKNKFIQNQSSKYGAIRLMSSAEVNIMDNEFRGNTCTGRYAETAGVFAEGGDCLGNITGNTFVNNVTLHNHSCINLNNFKGNITGNLFQSNRTDDAIEDFTVYVELSTATGKLTQIANNFIVDNIGNGVLIKGGSADTKFFVNNTLANQTRNHLVIDTDGWNIYNNIFYGGRTCILENAVYTIPLENNMFFKFKNHLYLDNNQDAYDDLLSFEFWKDEAKRNVEDDPLFVDPANWDYHLAPASPAIDGAYDGSKHTIGTYPELLTDFDKNIRPLDVAGINNNVYQGGDDYDEYDIGADELMTGAAFAISGKVIDTDGNPIENVQINCTDLYSTFSDSTMTAADGSYSISGLSQSRYRLMPSKTDHTFWPHYRDVAVTYGDKTDVNFESIIEGNPTFLRGTVLDFTGKPISGVSVYISDQGAGGSSKTKLSDVSTTITTNAQGQFNTTVPAGPGYSIILTKDGYQQKQVSDITAPNDLIIYMELTVPAPPVGLTASGGAESILLDWAPSAEPSVVGYNLYRDTKSNGDFINRINTSMVMDTEYEDTDVTKDQTYWYKVTAVNLPGYESQKSAAASAKAGGVEIFVRNARGPAGGSVRIPINLSEASGVSCTGFSVAFTYDSSVLTPVSFEKTFLTKDFTIDSDIGTGTAGTVVFTGNCGSPVTIPAGSGAILHVIFNVDSEATGDSALNFGDVTLQNSQGEDLTMIKTGALFTVADDYILGDIDGDGDVDGDDAALGQRIVVDLHNPTDLEFNAGEINGDRVIDSADINLVLRLADGDPINPSGDVPTSTSLYIVTIGSASANPGDRIDIPVKVNPIMGVAGCDFSIVYDASRVAALNVDLDAGMAAGFILEKNVNEAGKIFITISSKSDAATGDEVTIANISFEIDETADKTVVPLVWQLACLSRQFGQKVRWEASSIDARNGIIYVGGHQMLPFHRVVNYILGREEFTVEEFYMGDATEDACIDICDLVWMMGNGYGP